MLNVRSSSPSQQRENTKNAKKRLEMLLSSNFGPRDILFTLTYDIPLKSQRLTRQRNFIKALRNARREYGAELKYICVTEKRPDERYFHHFVINSSNFDDFKMVSTLWTCGCVDGFGMIEGRQPAEIVDFIASAHAKTKPVGAQMWTRSRGNFL